ncbi:hypothetical protein CMQ_4355 [Grosmannia clavigera kw1407]|uniref:SPRY domain-containing protein n=1 Tax=Grosmannia clavigera (strain kw1407 / UAMH 11150) TaxID=655863 RepID=F0XU41_GROCL|nr:uncharacterized protein CMQ_4355 [Grosmannia clavigera kw1407]EFW98503.1 hypothetical protein CMQ_4355 [Grosmannia clavigera kw1407]
MASRPAAVRVSSDKTARPPQQQEQYEQYAPPPGPPPTLGTAGSPAKTANNSDDYAPPPGPPPGQHDWQSAVPDTALFPPPPAVFETWERSPANNASAAESEAGAAWCREHELQLPSAASADLTADPWARQVVAAHDTGLIRPPGFCGSLQRLRPGVWAVQTTRAAADTCLLGYPALYAPSLHSPLLSSTGQTAYYEVFVRPDSRDDEIGLALGMAALPYPAFRLPGWHRGSLAVHGDDGHRYVVDDLGGRSFTRPFRRGDTYGLGMRFVPATTTTGRSIDVEVFFTRNGTIDGRWDLHEEVDANCAADLTGLEGFHNISAAIGTFDAVSFEVRFDPALWAYKG